MKRVTIWLIALLFSQFTLPAQEITPLSEKAILKLAKKEAKALADDGWRVVVGGLPIEKQFIRFLNYSQTETTEPTTERIVCSSTYSSTSHNIAITQAKEQCKQEAIGKLASKLSKNDTNRTSEVLNNYSLVKQTELISIYRLTEYQIEVRICYGYDFDICVNDTRQSVK